MNILITGALGASGKVLEKYLLQEKTDNNIFYSDIKVVEKENYFQCDLAEKENVTELLKKVKPKLIYHLAGSFSNDFEFDLKCNVVSTKNIFDAILKLELNSRILIIGSAGEYGFVREDENPIKETHNLNPCSIYGLTKVYQTQLMQYYYNMYNLDVVMARTFNLIGEGFSEKLFIGKLYSQIKKYKSGEISKIILGNLENKRDYIDIYEAIKYYVKIAEKGKSGEVYNVGSGYSLRMRELLKKILLENNLDFSCIEIKEFTNNNKFDIRDIYADVGKLEKCVFVIGE